MLSLHLILDGNGSWRKAFFQALFFFLPRGWWDVGRSWAHLHTNQHVRNLLITSGVAAAQWPDSHLATCACEQLQTPANEPPAKPPGSKRSNQKKERPSARESNRMQPTTPSGTQSRALFRSGWAVHNSTNSGTGRNPIMLDKGRAVGPSNSPWYYQEREYPTRPSNPTAVFFVYRGILEAPRTRHGRSSQDAVFWYIYNVILGITSAPF